ncbi:hypothetical protein [Streptomyces sp. NPDC001635]
MTTDTYVGPYDAAAQRARVVAEIARDRFAPPATMSALGFIAAHLDAAAAAFEAVPPGAYDELPTEACEELFRAQEIAAQHPAARFAADFGEYILVPLIDRALPFPDRLDPADLEFADFGKREADLVHALHRLEWDGEHQWERTDDWLRQVFTVWRDWMRLAAEVHVHNSRPENQR